jgi:hypothetical protein
MRFRGVLVALSCAVVAAVALAPSAAFAGKKYVYTAKYMCPAKEGGDAYQWGLGGGFAGNIYYETVTTVHNPTEQEVEFNKHFVLAYRQHQLSSFQGVYGANQVTADFGHILDPGDAIGIDCDSVIKHLKDSWIDRYAGDVNERLDGMIVIESGSSLLQVQTLYGVIVLDFDEGPGTSGASVDVETSTPIQVKGKFRLAPSVQIVQ